MRNADELIKTCHRLDGKSYGAYKQLAGEWEYGDFTFALDRVQSDPFAPASNIRVTVPLSLLGIANDYVKYRQTCLPLTDFIARRAQKIIFSSKRANPLKIASCGQEILDRSWVQVYAKEQNPVPEGISGPDSLYGLDCSTLDFNSNLAQGTVELRLQLSLPARGRTILGHSLARFLDYDLPEIVYEIFAFGEKTLKELRSQVQVYLDYLALQDALKAHSWVSFIADESILARACGISDLPLQEAVPFTLPFPSEMNHSLYLPYAGRVAGLAIPEGITLLVGGGYHGKSTLLQAIERGVYPHIPGDGREYVATRPDALKIQAEEGRAVTSCDISRFIDKLPANTDTTCFTANNASGSTSQAAALIEGIEAGSKLFLIDEDTSATNLLIRDQRMRELVPADPITPLVDRARQMWQEEQISLIMVVGGSGDYLAIADQVIALENYLPSDVGEQAKAIAAKYQRQDAKLENPLPISAPKSRKVTHSPVPLAGKRPKIKTAGTESIILNKTVIDTRAIAGIVDSGQNEAVAFLLKRIVEQETLVPKTIGELAKLLKEKWQAEKWQLYAAGKYPAFLVTPRFLDLVCALNRYRHLRIDNSQYVREGQAE